MTVDYISTGAVYTLPTYEYYGIAEYTHVIEVDKDAPVVGANYSNYSSMPDTYLLYTNGGSIMAGQFLTFYIYYQNAGSSSVIEDTYTIII